MAQLRIALAQINPTVGDLTGNARLILGSAREAAAQGAHLLATPEMALTGYPVEDLALRPSFVRAARAALDRLAGELDREGLGELVVVAGYLDDRAALNGSAHEGGRTGRGACSPVNAAAVIHRGSVLIRSAKHHLPNYGVFDEYRYFVPGDVLPVVRVRGVDVAVAICEDLWQDGGPVAAADEARAGLLLSINASPYELEKDDVRYELLARRAAEAGCAVAYVNQIGGQDELVFDGDSIVVAADGRVVARAGQFTEELFVTDLDLPRANQPAVDATAANGMTIRRVVASADQAEHYLPRPAVITPRLDDLAEIYRALVMGLRDYVRKNGFTTVTLGLSGGIDSALVAAIACDALGPQNVYGVSLPSRYSSEHSKDDAEETARRTGLHYETVPIAPMVESYLKTLADSGTALTGLAEENLQARVRGTALMALSNQRGHLVLATGNKSELAVGYSTLYGDAVGAFGPIKDVSKSLVWALARWRDEEAERRGQVPPIPRNSIEKEPSAELRPGQKDTDSLPAYQVLDEILDLYVEGDHGREEIEARGFDPALVQRVLRLTDTAEYKRRQYPPGTKISAKAFGRDRRLPITSRWREVP
ncbi:NAD+ synthase [Actinocrinis puniceicyclus]|uniref:Glutamine-dependent NAD(+) synthetase n=1 Tax=Actinocrinis puniceicyclus TaxID=977794 RepID=A0A8J7WQJ3_9ACTN|nr:NAD+ synthase [Actinocrinis puniceicyclus]MBS2964572.1 NAD+ synthase [Actinocrinis puniceicyclus]